ncbi:hypothetical protein [Mesorhizobium sp. Z1-4]|uniref:hypothetical protein n=1 Tax=Mesorhizobium sp. Z1-4 TaxID=2448478 RepID=UPI00197FAF3D|nr:hypothetical protein [Mesorhizobium sp. Z1-4]
MIKSTANLAAMLALSLAFAAPALADTYLGSYMARLSERDHFASDGYRLDTAAQVVRQDRANVHRFKKIDAEDGDDPWFGKANARNTLEQFLNRREAMDEATRSAIHNGTPLVQVDVYQNSAVVTIIGSGGGGGSGGISGGSQGTIPSN